MNKACRICKWSVSAATGTPIVKQEKNKMTPCLPIKAGTALVEESHYRLIAARCSGLRQHKELLHLKRFLWQNHPFTGTGQSRTGEIQCSP